MKDELFLLSVEEYEKYKGVIPIVNSWWWLRSPGYFSNIAANVSNVGSVNTNGYYVNYTDGIRPALRVSKSEISRLQIGDRKIYYDFPFVKIDDDLLISEVPIAFDKFDYESNDYEKSYVKRFLEKWKDGRQMYKSIIDADKYENDMVNVVQSYGFNVDKEELTKSLAYDRGQYEKGFADGVRESIQHGHWITHNDGDPFLIYGSCSNCGFEQSISSTLHYCPDCGAKMDDEVEE